MNAFNSINCSASKGLGDHVEGWTSSTKAIARQSFQEDYSAAIVPDNFSPQNKKFVQPSKKRAENGVLFDVGIIGDFPTCKNYPGDTSHVAFCSDPFMNLRREIANSEQMLNVIHDLDDEENVTYDRETWQNATNWLLRMARAMYRDYTCLMVTPRILPGPNGQIDISWLGNKREFLVVVSPQDQNGGRVEGFGMDDKGTSIKTVFDLKGDVPALPVAWVLEQGEGVNALAR